MKCNKECSVTSHRSTIRFLFSFQNLNSIDVSRTNLFTVTEFLRFNVKFNYNTHEQSLASCMACEAMCEWKVVWILGFNMKGSHCKVSVYFWIPGSDSFKKEFLFELSRAFHTHKKKISFFVCEIQKSTEFPQKIV